MKWLIVGGGGQFGCAMQAELANAGVEFVVLSHARLDITNENAVMSVFKEIRPEIVLNAAAWTNVDDAEGAESEARLVNAFGPGVLAKACSINSSKFVHLSTDYVFSGISRRPWSESEVPNPVSAYGRTKAEGELLVQSLYPEGSFILRTAWLYSPWGRNFAKIMVQLALEGKDEIEVIDDQVGQPTLALDLAKRIHQMIDTGLAPGIYHGTNSGSTSWFNFAREIFQLAGADPDRVIPVESNRYLRAARRPAYSVLGHDGWSRAGLNPMRDWQEALQDGFPAIISAVRQGRERNGI